MVKIEVYVQDGDEPGWVWKANVSGNIVAVARASKNPAIFKDLTEMMLNSAVGVCMNPDAVPPGAASAPLDIL